MKASPVDDEGGLISGICVLSREGGSASELLASVFLVPELKFLVLGFDEG